MQNQAFETKRTQDGAIDVRFYAAEAAAQRRNAKTQAMRKLGSAAKRAALAAVALLGFWNIPAMGGPGS